MKECKQLQKLFMGWDSSTIWVLLDITRVRKEDKLRKEVFSIIITENLKKISKEYANYSIYLYEVSTYEPKRSQI